MIDLRKHIVILVIAILFTVFVFSTINAFYDEPEYRDFCKNDRISKSLSDREKCDFLDATEEQQNNCKGYLEPKYNKEGCIIDYTCQTCQVEYDNKRDIYNRNAFVIASIIGVITVLAGLYLPAEKNIVNEWIGTAFMIGGLFVIFFATMMYFSSLDKFIKPLVMLIEIILVVWLTYKKFSSKIK